MKSCCGITISSREWDLEELRFENDQISFEGHHQEGTDGDLWEQLEFRPLEDSHPTLRQGDSLANEIHQHPSIYLVKEYLRLRTNAPDALGIGVPYASGPIIRGALRRALNEAGRDLWGTREQHHRENRVFVVEVPVAVCLERHAAQQFGRLVVVSPGGAKTEASILDVSPNIISMRYFREYFGNSNENLYPDLMGQLNRLGDDRAPVAWILVSSASGSLISKNVPPVDFENIGLEAATRGAARYALSCSTSADSRLCPQIERLVPRPIGLVVRNTSGSVFWHRLLSACDNWTGQEWLIRGFGIGAGVIQTAAWTNSEPPSRWISGNDWKQRLHSWQEPVPVPALEPELTDRRPVRLMTSLGPDGFFLTMDAPPSTLAAD